MSNILALNWPNIQNGSIISRIDFPSVMLFKLDDTKALYFNYSNKSVLVDVKEHVSERHGKYYFFQSNQNDWIPLTTRYWQIYDRK